MEHPFLKVGTEHTIGRWFLGDRYSVTWQKSWASEISAKPEILEVGLGFPHTVVQRGAVLPTSRAQEKRLNGVLEESGLRKVPERANNCVDPQSEAKSPEQKHPLSVTPHILLSTARARTGDQFPV